MTDIIEYDAGISAVDSGYIRPMMAAIHLIREGDRAALVDTGTNASIPRVLRALASNGLAPESVDYVMLTHIHLDHAGGAGGLMQVLPNAKLTVHPRGARHMADPSKLIEGTIAVYGLDETRAMYGDILPIAKERIVETGEGAEVNLNGRRFSFLDTPGHARHQVAIHDHGSGCVFAGDTFGVSFRDLDWSEGGQTRQFIFPTTTPVQFDPSALIASIERIVDLKPPAVYATHYGQVNGVHDKARVLRREIEALVALAMSLKDAGATRHERLVAGVEALLVGEATLQGCPHAAPRLLEVYQADSELNAQGLEVWLDTLH
jgi:hydroxyacylglutathione hydrolase